MLVVFTEKDWQFIEGRFLRGSRYKDPHVSAWASHNVRQRIDRLLNQVVPRYAENVKRHISADQENKARTRVFEDLQKMKHMIRRWENIKGASLFVYHTECEVEREIEAPHEFLTVTEDCTWSDNSRAIRKQQPGNFESFKFEHGTLFNLIERYERGAKRTELHQKARRPHLFRPETIVCEVVACQLADLWEDITGSLPKTSNNSGFMQTINYLYERIDYPKRGSTSLKNDLENYFITRPTSKATNLP